MSVKGRPSCAVQKLPGPLVVRLNVPAAPSIALVATLAADASLDCATRTKRDVGIWPSAAAAGSD